MPEWKEFTADRPFVMEFKDEPSGRQTEPDDIMMYRINYTLESED